MTRLSAPMLIQCLAGELMSDPSELIELIKEDSETLQAVRAYGKGELNYDTILEKVGAIC